MSDAPKRIWINEHGGNWSPVPGGTQEVQYILKEAADRERDVAVREALERAALVLDNHNGQPIEPSDAWSEEFVSGFQTGQLDAATSWQFAIRALIPDEGRASLDAMLWELEGRLSTAQHTIEAKDTEIERLRELVPSAFAEGRAAGRSAEMARWSDDDAGADWMVSRTRAALKEGKSE